MMRHLFVLAALLGSALGLSAQAAPELHGAASADTSHYQLFGGYSFQSNSFNGVPGHTQSLNGWDVSFAFPRVWHNLRIKLDLTQYRGNNYGAPQHAYSVVGGGQYEHRFGRETLYGEALFGDIGINQNWGPNAHPGMTASFTEVLGGGLDTPISRRFAVRVSGDWVYENFALIQAVNYTLPERVPGLPNFFGKVSTGVVWKF